MINIPNAQAHLFYALRTDPTLALAALTGWLDPMSAVTDFDPEYDSDPDAYLTNALLVCRSCFPEVYGRALAMLRSGCQESRIERAICDGVNQHLVAQVNDLEEIAFDLPHEAYGVTWDSLEENTPRLIPVAAAFGIPEHRNSEQASSLAQILRHDLSQYPEGTVHNNLFWLLGWMFGLTGNTLMDYDQEGLWESGLEAPGWTPDDIAFFNDIQTEANEMLQAADLALDILETDPLWMGAFRNNIKLIERRLRGDTRSLQWPAVPICGASDTTDRAA